jgi:hypothetical protein
MKYIVFRKEEITQDMLNSINGNQVTVPSYIYLIDPPEETPGGVLSDYLYITTEEDYPSAFQFYRKLSEAEYQDVVAKIKEGEVPNYKLTDNIDQDPTGRPVVRTAATVKGWHYQFHSVDFITCKLGSVINIDVNGNDLGFSELKVYKSDGSECTTQVDADANGVKSVLTWKPNFDFEIISGNTRQESKQSTNMRMYTTAKVYTGAPAPFDWFSIPFVQGGLNLKYIGADEILKTDGRASKLLKGSQGDHFEITLTHDAGLQHELSIVFEIYKDPQA